MQAKESNEIRSELRSRAIDAAIKAMGRNRALLFTLNLVVATIIVTIYLERESFDDKQRRAHMVALQDIALNLRDIGLPKEKLVSLKADSIEDWIWKEIVNQDTGRIERVPPNGAGITDPGIWLQSASTQLYRLRRVRNELGAMLLPSGQALALGISVPRNDIVPIAGIFLLMLYSWLYFSMKQLGAIVEKLREILVSPLIRADDSNTEEILTPSKSQSMVRQIIEFHFMFKTSEGGPTSWSVKGLYYSPPIAMFAATINDLYSIGIHSVTWGTVLRALASARMFLEFGLLIALTFVAYQIKLADDEVNFASYRNGEPESSSANQQRTETA